MNFSIREATVKDITEIQLIRRAVKENVLLNPERVTDEDCKIFITQRGKGWVAVYNESIVGFAIVDMRDDNVWALFIHPDYEKMGVGKKLHDTMLNWYFGNGKTKIWLSTDPNTRAEKFYGKQNWTRKEVLPNGEIKFEMTLKEWRK